jgi:hypothetical protein
MFRQSTSAGALARDHGISWAAACYLDEAIIVPARQAPDLPEALERAMGERFSHVILDGNIIACDRRTEPAVSIQGEVIYLWCSGKAHVHGGNVQPVRAPDRFPLWVFELEPGSVPDITAARARALPGRRWLACLADPGYEGAGLGILIPARQPTGGQQLGVNSRTCNAIQSSLRCPGERGFVSFTGRWHTLDRVTASPNKIGDIACAVLVLTHRPPQQCLQTECIRERTRHNRYLR